MRRWNHPQHGRLLTPRHHCRPFDTAAEKIPWAADCDGYNGVDRAAYKRMVFNLVGVPGCLFLVVPDVYLGENTQAHDATMESWRDWYPFLRMTAHPLAFVAQIGATTKNIPWNQCGAIFLGGDTAWKLGPTAREIAQHAKRLGKHVHMGRVNSAKRIAYARSIGCDSVDGSGWAKYRDAMMPIGIAALNQQTMELGL